MKRNIVLFFITTFIMFLTCTNSVMANISVSGPTPSSPDGNNGWYKTLGFGYSIGCGSVLSTNGSGYIPLIGIHHIDFYKREGIGQGCSLSVQYDNGEIQMLGSINNAGSGGNKFLSFDYQLETGIDSFQINSPSNNSNTNESTVTVTGFSNTVSGIGSVIVNGHAANVTGNNWSIDLLLQTGLNEINATMTSIAGNTAPAATVVVLSLPEIPSPTITETPSQSSNNSTMQQNISNSTSSPSPTQSQVSPSPKVNSITQNNVEDLSPTPETLMLLENIKSDVQVQNYFLTKVIIFLSNLLSLPATLYRSLFTQ